MKFILIYGPPGVGKLTVAKELRGLTDFPIFHNHLSYDFAAGLIKENTGPFWELVAKIRLVGLEFAAKAAVPGVIHTYCYSPGSDDEYVSKLVAAVEDNGGLVLPVLLRARPSTLHERIKAPERADTYKISSAETLERVLNKHDFSATIPGMESLVIDNDEVSAADSAVQIKDHFRI